MGQKSVQKGVKPNLLKGTTFKRIAMKVIHLRKKGVIIIGEGSKALAFRSQLNRSWFNWRIAGLSFPRRTIIYNGVLSEK